MYGTAERAKKGQKVKQMAQIWVFKAKTGQNPKTSLPANKSTS
jgi:hypothetical protein